MSTETVFPINSAGLQVGNLKFLKAQRRVGEMWEDCNFRELRKGDTFRLEAEDGGWDPRVFVAATDAQPPSLKDALNPYAVWGIQVACSEV